MVLVDALGEALAHGISGQVRLQHGEHRLRGDAEQRVAAAVEHRGVELLVVDEVLLGAELRRVLDDRRRASARGRPACAGRRTGGRRRPRAARAPRGTPASVTSSDSDSRRCSRQERRDVVDRGSVTKLPPPAPFAVRIRFWAASTRSASRTVPRLTPNSRASTASLGSRSPRLQLAADDQVPQLVVDLLVRLADAFDRGGGQPFLRDGRRETARSCRASSSSAWRLGCHLGPMVDPGGYTRVPSTDRLTGPGGPWSDLVALRTGAAR